MIQSVDLILFVNAAFLILVCRLQLDAVIRRPGRYYCLFVFFPLGEGFFVSIFDLSNIVTYQTNNTPHTGRH